MSIATDSSPPGDLYCPTCEQAFHRGDRCPNDGTRLVKLAARIDALLGRDLDGRYTILEKLGQGGMGAVYRSSQHSVGREVAIKVVSPHLVSEPDVIKRFLREAKLASRLSHPNAVGVLDFGQTDDGIFYLVMELVSGRTLDAVIKSERVFKAERVVRIGTQICDALEGAHALQIVHRDLKPANIMLMSSGRDLVKVLDFGLAKSVAPDQTSTTMTNAGALLGTPAYMPPELALGLPCDGRADLYSLGVVLYQLGAGRLPFESDSAHELIAMHGTETAPLMTNVPPALGRVIDRLLAKDPARRYQSASDTREALEAALENRYNTPALGLPVTSDDTNVSIGPFPAASADFAAFSTLPPTSSAAPSRRARSATEIDRLGSSDTIAPGLHTSRSVHEPRSRALPIVLGTIGALGIGVIAFMVARSGGQPASEPQPSPPPLVAPTAPAADRPRQEPAVAPTPELAVPATPAPTPHVTPDPATTAPTEMTVDTKPPPLKPLPPHSPKPHGHVVKPVVKPPPVEPPPAQGSAAATKPKLPF